MARIIFGCGYLGGRVARLWKEAGEQVYVVTRSSAKTGGLSAAGLTPIIADITNVSSLSQGAFPTDIETVLFAVGYDRGSARPIRETYAGGLRNVLSSNFSNTVMRQKGRFIYISSTGVYGTAAGEWVDEETPCNPTREGGKASLAAEQELRGHPLGARSIILRLAGIYGPGRIPRRDDLLSGRPIDAPAEGWLNLIHVDDAARIVLLAERHSSLPNLFVVADGVPVPRADYYRELARLLGAPPPQFVSPDPSSPAALRAGSDKRIRTEKLRRELAPQLRYPSYLDGLAAILESEGN